MKTYELIPEGVAETDPEGSVGSFHLVCSGFGATEQPAELRRGGHLHLTTRSLSHLYALVKAKLRDAESIVTVEELAAAAGVLRDSKKSIRKLITDELTPVRKILGDNCIERPSAAGYRLRLSVREVEPSPSDQSPAGKLVGIPQLPAHFRVMDGLDDLRKLLLHESWKPDGLSETGRLIGIHGMGGIGKSVLASALARDPDVRRAFPHGIFWVTLGQQAKPEERQRWLVRELGGKNDFQGVDGGKEALRALLNERAVLLVLDNVWKREEAEAFNTIGPRGSLLLTTRDVGLLAALTGRGTHFQVQLPNPSEARILLAKAASLPPDDLPPQATDVIKRCGRLPLALTLCGGMVRGSESSPGVLWTDLLDALAGNDLAFLSTNHPAEEQHASIPKAIDISLRVLSSDHQKRFLELVVFGLDAGTPEAAVATLWEHTAGLRQRESRKLLAEFVARSLLQQPRAGEILLHDLLHSFGTGEAIRFWGSLRDLNQSLLQAYAKKCPNGWPSGPDDGYFFEHLAGHLVAAGRKPELLELLTGSSDWMESKFGPCHGDASFVADLELVSQDPGELRDPSELTRWVAIRAVREVIALRISEYNADDLATLTLLGREREALNHARLQQRISSYLAIYEAQRHRGQPDRNLVDEAMSIANWRATSLIAIAEALLPEQDQRFAGILDQVVQAVSLLDLDDTQRSASRISALLIAACDQRADKFLQMAITEERGDLALPAMAALQYGIPGVAVLLVNRLSGSVRVEVMCAQILAMRKARDAGFGALLEEVLRESRKENELCGPYLDGVKCLGAVAETLAAVGDLRADLVFKEAVKAANSINSWDNGEIDQRQALIYLARAAARSSRFDLAERIARERNVRRFDPETFGFVCRRLALAGAPRARELFDEHLRNRQEVCRYQGRSAPVDVARGLAQAGYLDLAWAVARSIVYALDRLDALVSVALGLAAAGREDSGTAFDEAAAALESAGSGSNSDLAESRLISALARSGRFAQAELRSGPVRYRGGLSIAKAYALQGEFDLAEQAARSIGNELHRAEALLRVAIAAKGSRDDFAERIYADTVSLELWGRWRGEPSFEILPLASMALDYFEESEKFINQLESDRNYRGFAAEAVQCGHLRRELTLALGRQGAIAEAERVARTLQRDWERINTLAALATLLRNAGDVVNFERLLAELGAIPEAQKHVRVMLLREQYRRSGGDVAAADAIASFMGEDPILWTLPGWQAATGSFREVFDGLGVEGQAWAIDTYIKLLPAFERAQAGLGLDILRTSLRIAGWHSDRWQRAVEALGESSKRHEATHSHAQSPASEKNL